MVSAINYKPRGGGGGGVPIKVCGCNLNTQTLGFRQLKVTSDLSNHCVLPGQYSLVSTQRLGSSFSMPCAKHTLKYFRRPDLLVVCACSLTVCEPVSLLWDRSFETLRCPKLKSFLTTTIHVNVANNTNLANPTLYLTFTQT